LTAPPPRVTLVVMRALGNPCPRSLFLAAGLLALVGCAETVVEEPPTAPGPPTGGGPLTPINPIPAAPAPQPTPRPSATPTPPFDNDPPGGGGNPPSGSCGPPAPPPLGRIQVGLLIVGAGRLILDSTPLVGPDAAYCREIGFTDGRQFCPVRPEGHPERFACEAGIIGVARDTGRVGPTWSANNNACIGGAGNVPYCNNHPENQFLVFAVGSGTFRACAQNGICGAYTVP
jgi:hypothetical protein